jgi:hypothetical protein
LDVTISKTSLCVLTSFHGLFEFATSTTDPFFLDRERKWWIILRLQHALLSRKGLGPPELFFWVKCSHLTPCRFFSSYPLLPARAGSKYQRKWIELKYLSNQVKPHQAGAWWDKYYGELLATLKEAARRGYTGVQFDSLGGL